MLVAIFFVLSNYLSINLAGMRITLDVLPVIVAAALYGPVDAAIVGAAGYFLFQLAGPYGISVTTPLWCLPDLIRGLLAGLALKNRWQSMSPARLILTLCCVSLLFTATTTGVMYLDCVIIGYSFAAYAPFVLTRLIAGLAVAVITALILPPLGRALQKNGGKFA